MGTISEKLVYLDGTREQIKENLNKFGSNITENDTFRSYSNVINDIYDKLPKVSGNGSDFSLENAQNGKLDSFGMDGNTEQTTYSGKNLYKWSNVTYSSDVTTTTWCFQDGTGGAYGGNITNKSNSYSFELEAGTYTMSGNSIDSNILVIQAVKNGSPDEIVLTSNNLNPSTSTATITLTEKTTLCVRYRVTDPSLGIGNTKIQIEQGSTATSFEPYVGGTPSPNPDYPQDVKVVENEQIVNVHGKNLVNYDNNTNLEAKFLNASGVFESAIYTYANGTIKANSNKITISFNNSVGQGYVRIGEYKEDGTFIKRNLLSTTPTTLTLDSNTSYLIYSIDKNSDNYFEKLQIEKGTQATTFEPYQSQDFEIDLHGKNLFDKDSVILGKVWNGASNTKRAYGYIKAIQGQVYTASTQDTSSDLNIYITETAVVGTGGEHIKQTELTSTLTFTPQSATEYIVVQFSTTTNDITQEMVNNALIQIEKGSTATEYEPYYNYELCKINTYKDSIKKSTGKNLAYNFGNIWYSTTSNTFTNNSNFKSCKAKVKPNTTYTISKKNVSNRYVVYASEVDIVAGVPLGRQILIFTNPDFTNYTFTTRNNENYIFFGYIASTDAEAIAKAEEEIMIEEGSTATSYEPFGTDWYIKKAIGKVVFDGSEFWGYGGSSTPNVFYTTIITDYATSNNTPYSNYYIGNINVNGASGMSSLANNTIAFINVSGGTTPRFYIKDTKYTLSSDLKTWLETHNLIVYYVLATPTYETITNETLISQLESIETFTGLNYFSVSNDNNVLPTLYVSRLKELDSLT